MHRTGWRFLWLFLAPLFLFGLQEGVVYAEHSTVVAQAVPDECWNGCGQPYISWEGSCPDGAIPKQNHQYLWGLTKWGKDVWIGTGANISSIGSPSDEPLEDCEYNGPPDNPVNVIELNLSQYPGVPRFLRPYIGDWRPPQVWVYDIEAKVQIPITLPYYDRLIDNTLGLRAAGASDGVVLLAGPRRIGLGLNMFAFDANTREYLGSETFAKYSNIRKFVQVNGQLYTGVQDTSGKGSILRWVGNRYYPFRFVEVGSVDGDPANLTVHEDRIFAATWAGSSQSSMVPNNNPPLAGIWMSPPMDSDHGLTPLDARSWTKVWEVNDYEVEESIAATQGVGDLASFGGYLYWGTMNPPWNTYESFVAKYGEPVDPQEVRENLRRAIAVFRGRNFDSNPEIQLLYGEEKLPKYDPATATWNLVDNSGGLTPMFGPSGFGYQTNVYTWTMAVYQGKLYVGTIDNRIHDDPGVIQKIPGADVWVFAGANLAATALTTDGFGDPVTVQGIRTMESSVEGLFLGSQGKANLIADGGWKLIQVTP